MLLAPHRPHWWISARSEAPIDRENKRLVAFLGSVLLCCLVACPARAQFVPGTTRSAGSVPEELAPENRECCPLQDTQGRRIPLPRVSGLSVSVERTVPVPNGVYAEFSVQMTTQRIVTARSAFARYGNSVETSLFFPIAVGHLSDEILRVELNAFPSDRAQRLGLLQDLATASHSRVLIERDSFARADPESAFTTASPMPFTGARRASTLTIVRHFQQVVTVSASRAGIDFGDGVTLATASLPLVSTPSTVSIPGEPSASVQTRVYRRSGFSHTYPSVGSAQVTVRSGCCSLTNFPHLPLTHSPSQGGATGILNRRREGLQRQYRHRENTDNAGYFAITGANLSQRELGSVRSFSQTRSTVTHESDTSGAWPISTSVMNVRDVDQVTATVQVDLFIQAVPVAGSLSLGALSLALALAGLALLRR